MRRLGRTSRFVLVFVVLGVCAVAASGYGGRLLSVLRAASWNLDVERAMDAAGVRPGMVVGEAGAGDGYFTLPMARRIGAAGAVYANDISRRALGELADHAKRERLDNIQTVVGDVDDPRFPRRDLELIVVVHAFHDFDQPVEWLRNARQYLRPGGAVVIIDRDPLQGAERHFWSREQILGHARSAGYEMTKLVDDISSHLIIVITPAEPRRGAGSLRGAIASMPRAAV
jgi:ubiquinone/menaquinone biosynthesis C-methylase UbiE